MDKRILIGGVIVVIVVAVFLLGFGGDGYTSDSERVMAAAEVGVVIGSGVSVSDVGKHGEAIDCWMILNDKVYDVTDYISSHPGGEGMTEFCGKDATDAFEGKPHSPGATKTLGKYYIREVEG